MHQCDQDIRKGATVIAIISLAVFIAGSLIVLWYLSERAHARAETAAMRQLKSAIQFLKQSKNK